MDKPPPPLTQYQQAESEALYRELCRMWAAGTRQVIVTRDHDGGIGVGSVNRRFEIRVTLNQLNS